jgi:hypothetical protein
MLRKLAIGSGHVAACSKVIWLDRIKKSRLFVMRILVIGLAWATAVSAALDTNSIQTITGLKGGR